MPPSFDRFWEHLVGHPPPPSHIQRLITRAMEDAIHRRRPKPTRVEQQRIPTPSSSLSSSSSSAAGDTPIPDSSSAPSRWLTAAPTYTDIIIDNADFTLAMRHYLNLPTLNLPSHCECGAELHNSTIHFHGCPKLRRRSILSRHESLKQCIASYARRAGINTTLEEPERDKDDRRTVPDLTFLTDQGTIFADITVFLPSPPLVFVFPMPSRLVNVRNVITTLPSLLSAMHGFCLW